MTAADPWAHIQPGRPERTLAAVHDQADQADPAPDQTMGQVPAEPAEQTSYEYAVLTGAGVLVTERGFFGGDETEPFTLETAQQFADVSRGTVQQRKVVRGPWQDHQPAPRTKTSPASAGQKKFVADLLRDRMVPEPLRQRAEACRREMTDGDARELIPLLKDCPKPGSRHDNRYDHEYDYDDMPGYNPGSQEHDV